MTSDCCACVCTDNKYLAVSGFELWGQLLDENGDVVANCIPAKPVKFKPHPMGSTGVFNHLGTVGGTEPWQNPATRGLVEVVSTTVVSNSNANTAILGRSLVRCVTKPEQDAYFQVNLKNHEVVPMYYTLRHYISWDVVCCGGCCRRVLAHYCVLNRRLSETGCCRCVALPFCLACRW